MIVPGPNPSKPDHIVADLGDFSMHNTMPSADSEDSLTLVCALNKMHMRSVRGGVETDILHDVRLDVVVTSEERSVKVP